jgi:RNA polymerase sigma-70 factor (ECF subfamily)
MKDNKGGRLAAVSNTTLQSQLPVEQMFWEHHQRILRAVYRITGNMADAEDVAQSVFTRLLKSGSSEVETAGSYLYRAAINGALDLVRSRQRGREVSLELASHVASSGVEGAPERQYSSGELRDWLRKALASLSPRSAEMFVLRYVEELSNQEIAELVGSSRAVVAVMLHQARSRLQKEFKKQMRGTR